VTTYALPLLATATASGLTYLFCIRPMRKGHTCHVPTTAPEPVEDVELDALREEVARLRRQVGAGPS
jgi:hypothetical protein